MNDYSGLSRNELEQRLATAEDVCVVFGWTAVRSGSDRDDALSQLWQKWAAQEHVLTSPANNPHLDDAVIHELAEQRRATREATLNRPHAEAAR